MDLNLNAPLRTYWRDRLATATSDTYRGRILAKFPEDLRTYQHVIEQSSPEVIVELGAYDGGSALWFHDQLQVICGVGEVISVDVNPVRPLGSAGIISILGDVTSPEVYAQVAELVSGRRCMVVEDSSHTYEVTTAALALYSDLVRDGQWFVVEDGVVDEPTLALPGWPSGVQPAISDFCVSGVGERFTRHWLAPYGLTTHHGGWLRSDDAR